MRFSSDWSAIIPINEKWPTDGVELLELATTPKKPNKDLSDGMPFQESKDNHFQESH